MKNIFIYQRCQSKQMAMAFFELCLIEALEIVTIAARYSGAGPASFL